MGMIVDDESLISIAEKYVEEMQKLKYELDTLTDKMKSDVLTAADYENYYGQEFEILILLSGAKYDLNKILNSITNKEYIFKINRFRKEADQLYDTLILE